jgi:hypothetical protein
MYDLRRLIPYSGNATEYTVKRLEKLDLIKKVQLGKVDFYVRPENSTKLEREAQSAILEDKTEYAVVKKVHELIMNLYPLDLIRNYRDAIRPHTRDVLRLTGGMSFDIFYEFCNPVLGRNYLAIDVYTRIPVNGYVLNSFMKKIEWARTNVRGKRNYYLKDKTYGMIVFKRATKTAIELANKRNIRFIRLSDIKIDFPTVQVETEKAIKKAASEPGSFGFI